MNAPSRSKLSAPRWSVAPKLAMTLALLSMTACATVGTATNNTTICAPWSASPKYSGKKVELAGKGMRKWVATHNLTGANLGCWPR